MKLLRKWLSLSKCVFYFVLGILIYMEFIGTLRIFEMFFNLGIVENYILPKDTIDMGNMMISMRIVYVTIALAAFEGIANLIELVSND